MPGRRVRVCVVSYHYEDPYQQRKGASAFAARLVGELGRTVREIEQLHDEAKRELRGDPEALALIREWRRATVRLIGYLAFRAEVKKEKRGVQCSLK